MRSLHVFTSSKLRKDDAFERVRKALLEDPQSAACFRTATARSLRSYFALLKSNYAKYTAASNELGSSVPELKDSDECEVVSTHSFVAMRGVS